MGTEIKNLPDIPDMPEFLITDAKARDEARKMQKLEKTYAASEDVGTAEVEQQKPHIPAKRAKANGKDNGKPLKAAAKPKATKPKVAKAKAAKPAETTVKAKGKGKAATRAPRTADPTKLDEFGLRKGSLKSRAAAMYASKKGATLTEVSAKLESTQFNVITQLVAKGWKLRTTKEAGDGPRQITRYFLSK